MSDSGLKARPADWQANLDQMAEFLPADAEAAARLSNEELIQILACAPVALARLLTRFAAVWKVAEERGIDLSEFLDNRHSSLIYKCVQRIAHEQLSALAVERFGLRPDFLTRVIAKLPLVTQERLAKDSSVHLLNPCTPEDLANYSARPIDKLQPWELVQVFDADAGELRSVPEQAVYLRSLTRRPLSSAEPPPKRRSEVKRGGVVIDPDRGRLRTIGADAAVRDAISALKALGYTITQPDED